MSPDRREIGENIGLDTQIQPRIEAPMDGRGRIRWSLLKPDERVIFIRQEAQALLLAGSTLTRKTAPLVMAGAQRFYPGGVNSLRVDLGQPVLKRGNGYWTPENTEAEVKQFFKENNDFSVPLLTKARKNSLVIAVHKYPGGVTALREKLGLEPRYKPKSYWTPENIETEARQFIDQNQKLSAPALVAADRADLSVAAVRKYPGGMRALQEKLGMATKIRPNGYWDNPKTIEDEARSFLEQGHQLIQKDLNRYGLSSLKWAASRFYPGGFIQLKIDLGIELTQKPKGYWKPERIEEEALSFYQTNGVLSLRKLKKSGRGDLSSAISELYPGAMRALKNKLGIGVIKEELTISSDKANEQLRKLLEGEI